VLSIIPATPLISARLHALLAGIPLTPLNRIASTIVSAAAEIDLEMAGTGYLLLDDGPVQSISQEELSSRDIYSTLDSKCRDLTTGGSNESLPAPIVLNASAPATSGEGQQTGVYERVHGAVVLIVGTLFLFDIYLLRSV
jgi:hypothetical protein